MFSYTRKRGIFFLTWLGISYGYASTPIIIQTQLYHISGEWTATTRSYSEVQKNPGASSQGDSTHDAISRPSRWWFVRIASLGQIARGSKGYIPINDGTTWYNTPNRQPLCGKWPLFKSMGLHSFPEACMLSPEPMRHIWIVQIPQDYYWLPAATLQGRHPVEFWSQILETAPGTMKDPSPRWPREPKNSPKSCGFSSFSPFKRQLWCIPMG